MRIQLQVGICKLLLTMKRFQLIAALLLMAGCSSNLDNEIIEQPVSSRTFHGYIEETEGEGSRVFLDSKMRILWNANDFITLFEGTTRNKQYIFLGDDGDNAGDFDLYKQGFGSGNDIDRYYALYPYASTTKYIFGTDEGVEDYIRYSFPATQTYKAGSIGKDANVMVAVTADLDDFDLCFRNVCSYLRVKLYGADQTVGSIEFTGNNGEALSGNIAITPVYKGYPSMRMLGTGTSITLDCGDGITIGTTKETATEFWVVIPPLNFSQGFTITVNGFYGGSQSYKISSNLTFVRNTYNTITRELNISSGAGTNIGIGNWDNGENIEAEI